MGRKFLEYGVYGVDFRRIALTEEQVSLFTLPTKPDAETLDKLNKDPRLGEFKINHNGQLFQVEVDALYAYAPIEFRNMVLGPVDKFFDERYTTKFRKSIHLSDFMD